MSDGGPDDRRVDGSVLIVADGRNHHERSPRERVDVRSVALGQSLADAAVEHAVLGRGDTVRECGSRSANRSRYASGSPLTRNTTAFVSPSDGFQWSNSEPWKASWRISNSCIACNVSAEWSMRSWRYLTLADDTLQRKKLPHY